MDEIVENSMVFGFERIMVFAIDIDKLNMANLVGILNSNGRG